MFTKAERHVLILKLIKEYDVERQSDLVKLLNEYGCEATQATVSRDIHDLHLIKQTFDGNKLKYVCFEDINDKVTHKHSEIYLHSVISVEYANNLIVIKTLSGMAQAAAVTVDKAKFDGVLGCIAGDDTILVVTKDETIAKNIVSDLNSKRF